MRHTLRGQPPPRSSTLRTSSHTIRPTVTHPVVESWLESIHPAPSPTGPSNQTKQAATASRQRSLYAVTTKPVGKHFDQLPAGLQDVPVNQSGRVWLAIRTALRALSFILALSALVVVSIFVKKQRDWSEPVGRMIPALAIVGFTFPHLVTLLSP